MCYFKPQIFYTSSFNIGSKSLGSKLTRGANTEVIFISSPILSNAGLSDMFEICGCSNNDFKSSSTSMNRLLLEMVEALDIDGISSSTCKKSYKLIDYHYMY